LARQYSRFAILGFCLIRVLDRAKASSNLLRFIKASIWHTTVHIHIYSTLADEELQTNAASMSQAHTYLQNLERK
jgi:hypothetical protein